MTCDHVFQVESIDNADAPDGSTRTLNLVCSLCGHKQRRLTQRSMAAIENEIAKGVG